MGAVKYIDLCGTEIEVGSFVAYAASWGRCPILKYGVVTRLEKRESSYRWNEEDGTEIPTLRVISVDRDAQWKNGKNLGYKWTVQKDGKEIALSFLDRLLVVKTLPLAARATLQKALRDRTDREQASKR